MMPELLPAMLSVEALEDNEVLKVEGVRTFSRICDKKQKTKIELLNEPKTVNKIDFFAPNILHSLKYDTSNEQ